MAYIVSIVGRSNVGKSTLFNRLIEKREAITSDTSGTTRDRIYGECEWNGFSFTVVDTGGFDDSKDDIISSCINSQVKIALNESDILMFVVDGNDGLTDADKEFANLLRRYKKPVVLVVNKIDNPTKQINAYEFSELQLTSGDELFFTISAINGSGTGDLLDKIVSFFDKNKKQGEEEKNIPLVAIIGQPNVGKSSLLNVLVGEERNIVSDIPGTTRDATDTLYNKFGEQFILVDTAGIRKKSKNKDDVEFYSSLRSIRAIKNSDVCVYMIDATLGIEAQDLTLLALADKYRKGIILLINKWDLLEKDNSTMSKFKKEIGQKIGLLNYIPMIFTSTSNKTNIFDTVKMISQVYKNKIQKIPTSLLNQIMLPIIERTPPTSIRGKELKIKYITQLFPNEIVSIAFFCNRPKEISTQYKRFLSNRLRENFSLEGVHVNIVIKQK
ncbi:MAG: ribosome biogenesis GTPase Der [Cytophagales bacterium]|jgi:GTP-binding protein|nr:ribosome biogenesis GTPase Der [Cytophagales bacterium]